MPTHKFGNTPHGHGPSLNSYLGGILSVFCWALGGAVAPFDCAMHGKTHGHLMRGLNSCMEIMSCACRKGREGQIDAPTPPHVACCVDLFGCGRLGVHTPNAVTDTIQERTPGHEACCWLANTTGNAGGEEMESKNTIRRDWSNINRGTVNCQALTEALQCRMGPMWHGAPACHAGAKKVRLVRSRSASGIAQSFARRNILPGTRCAASTFVSK